MIEAEQKKITQNVKKKCNPYHTYTENILQRKTSRLLAEEEDTLHGKAEKALLY